jgi:hypothetical protein
VVDFNFEKRPQRATEKIIKKENHRDFFKRFLWLSKTLRQEGLRLSLGYYSNLRHCGLIPACVRNEF